MGAAAELAGESLADLGPEVERLSSSAEELGRNAGRMTKQAIESAQRKISELASKVYDLWKAKGPQNSLIVKGTKYAAEGAAAAAGYQVVHDTLGRDIPWGRSLPRAQWFIQTAYAARPDLRRLIDASLAANEAAPIRQWGLSLAKGVEQIEDKANRHVGASTGSWISPEALAKAELLEDVSVIFGARGSYSAMQQLRKLMDVMDTCGPADVDAYLALPRRR